MLHIYIPMTRFAYLFLIIFCLPITIFPQERLGVESFRTLPSVGAPVLSPDGKSILYTVTAIDIEHNRRNSTLYWQALKKGEKKSLINNASDPQWDPNGGKISIRTSIEGVSGIYLIDMQNSAPPTLIAPIYSTNHFLGHPTRRNYAWSPDGKYIAYVSADPKTGNSPADENEPFIIERTLYKSRTGFSDNRITRIYLVDISSKAIKAITDVSFDSHSLTWSPDSKKIAFLSNHTDHPDDNYNNDLWSYELNSGKLTQLTNTIGTEHAPAWSPKGNWIAYSATIRPRNTKDSPPENPHIYALSLKGQPLTDLTKNLDRRTRSHQWHPSSEWLYFTASNKGKRILYRTNINDSNPEAIIEGVGMVGSFHLGKNQIVYTWQSPNQPTEIYMADLDGKNKKRVTRETEGWVQGKNFAQVEEFWFTSFDGTRVQGFVAYPKGTSAGAKIPVIHRIHGGPHGMYGYSFSDLNEMFVAKGYAVVFINPRGSTGYGQKFADGSVEAWGGGDFKDLMAGMDYALIEYPFLDKNRMGVTGGSYGGFMTNWVVTQTDRYKAAATVASVSNLISFYGTSLYQLLIETEFNGFPWDNYSLLWHWSPLNHVKNVSTPTLLLHGEQDMDVPITQAEEFYIALKKLGVPARFVRYPNEGHGVRQPQHREHYYHELIGWMDKYLRKKSESR